ncbi:MAG: hypothetical protein FWG67_04550 [Defluviitaleaceae bacterium]|nr:hypothetical protein [Defluviitaleaceae bacterium]
MKDIENDFGKIEESNMLEQDTILTTKNIFNMISIVKFILMLMFVVFTMGGIGWFIGQAMFK